MPGIAPATLNALIIRAKNGDASAAMSLQASGYDIRGNPVGVGTGMGLATPAATKRKVSGQVPSVAQATRANTYARMLRRAVGK